MSATLKISIVCHASAEDELKRALASLQVACSQAQADGWLSAVAVVLVDNGPSADERAKLHRLLEDCKSRPPQNIEFMLIGTGRNIGFGAGHNLAIGTIESDYHLVLNPDVELAPDSLANALRFMQENPDCGILTPLVMNAAGAREYLCKRYPTVFDLFLRGFAPDWLRQRYARRLMHYQMEGLTEGDIYWDPPIVSGCFMLIRSSLMQELGGFDPRFFLYFEDFDLSLRAAKLSRIAYVPAVKIIHTGGYAARKGWKHIWLFGRSALTFFNLHGWRWY